VNNNRYLAQENIKSSKKKSKVHTVFDTVPAKNEDLSLAHMKLNSTPILHANLVLKARINI
jgi:hypothetical protein